VIEDLEGATPEAPRGRHVMVVSLASAAGAVALFLALVVSPLELSALPRAVAPASNPSAVPVTALSGSSILSNVAQLRQRACLYGPGLQWILVPSMSTGARTIQSPSIAVAIEPQTGRAAPVGAVVNERTLWLTVTCATYDVFAPPIDVNNIPR
jgi:hypothetical protein